MNAMSWLPLALLSAAFAALVAIFGKLGLKGMDSTLATTLRAAIMFVFLLMVSGATGKFSGLGQIGGRDWLLLALAGVAGALSWLFYFWALKVGKVSQVAPVDRLSLIFAVALAAIFLGENLGWKTGLGAVLMSIGAILITLG
jgi:transporter family protein